MSLRIGGPKIMRALSFKNFYNEDYFKKYMVLGEKTNSKIINDKRYCDGTL